MSRALPFVAASLVLILLFRRYDLAEVGSTLRQGNAFLLVPLALFSSVIGLFVMAKADHVVVRAILGGEVATFWDMVRGRGGTSLVIAANYGAGQGSYGIWLARKTDATLGTCAGAIAYMMLCDLTAVCLVAAISLWATGVPVAAELRNAALVIAPLVASALIVIALIGPKLLPALQTRLAFLERFSGLTSGWQKVRALAYVETLFWRSTNLVGSTFFYFVAARCLDLDIPFIAFLAYLPLVFLVGSLPVNVGPFGVVQVAWIHFFARYAAEESVLALQVSFGALVVLCFALRAIPFLPGVIADIGPRPNTEETSGEAAEKHTP